MSLPVHLVGSVPLDSAQDVFATVSAELGDLVARLPDGETGERSGWVGFQIPRFRAHPALELRGSTVPGQRAEDVDAAARAEGERYERPRFGLVPGAAERAVSFDRPGYAAAALASYAVFRDARERGVVPARARFQVCLPTPQAPLVMFIDPEDIPTLIEPYRRAMLDDLDEILGSIPHDQLALQWDVAPEIAQLEGVWSSHYEDPTREITDELVQIGRHVPADVPVGFHMCYGDFGGKHFTEPEDLGLLTDLTNRVVDGLGRLDWVHMPVPVDRDDAAYFAPLDHLSVPDDTQLYLGVLHDSDGVPGALRRIGAARNHAPEFGIATECGFGRRNKDSIDALLRLHREVSEKAHH